MNAEGHLPKQCGSEPEDEDEGREGARWQTVRDSRG
jgi:hypothetical protein